MTGDPLNALVDAVRRAPSDYGALMRLGIALAARGSAAAARTVFAQAASAGPHEAEPRARLGTLLVDDGEHEAALREFASALELDAECREAHRGIAVVYEREDRAADAARAWRRGFPGGSFETSPFRGDGVPVRVLYLTSALGGNIPMQHVLDERLFCVTTLIAESAPHDVALPPHDVVFNAVGDADRCARALDRVEAICRQTRAPVVNAAPLVRATARARNAERLGALADVRMARTARFAPEELLDASGPNRIAAAGLTWPVLLRSPGYQTGEHFVRAENPAELGAQASALPGRTLLAMEFVDSRGTDGAFRKYRVMTIGGALYPVHLAIGDSWKVHYFRTGMAERADRREEEAAFLGDMRGMLGDRAVAALERVAATLSLDYGGIDFTVLADGQTLVFEANATMVLVPPDAGALWDYRRAPIARAIEATRVHVLARARAIRPSTPAARGARASERPPSS